MTDWKAKLDAYLHDPPEKALDLDWHEKRAEAHAAGHGLDDTEFYRPCDHHAAAADRLPWPRWQFLESKFDGEHNHFKHPLGKAQFKISPYRDADIAHARAWESRPKLSQGDERAQFFAYWRMWRWWSADKRDDRLAFLPADTRLPDHTIWVHNSIVSALQACIHEGHFRPAFLLMQIGPVQDYIAQARRTSDLWSGSYLLSYLVAAGLKHIALHYGPDNVIFPNLCGQPIFDLTLKDDIWSKASVQEKESGSEQTLWDSFGYDADYGRRRLLTPSLPNRFLAVIPAGKDGEQAIAIAKQVEKDIREQFAAIADSVWNWGKEHLKGAAGWHEQLHKRFMAQRDRFLEISWQVLPWPAMPDDAFALTAHLPDAANHKQDKGPRAGLWTILEMARRMKKDHRDVRNYKCDCHPPGTRNAHGGDISGWKDASKLQPDAKLDNVGAAWSALYQLVSWQLDAVRQTRPWKAWADSGWIVGGDQRKDALNGKEEAILDLTGRKEEEIEQINERCGIPHLLKAGELIGASTLIKRLWPTAWLQKQHDFLKSGDFSMPDTRQIAEGKPFARESGDEGSEEEGKYFAVLALDGDEMGKWVSGLHPAMPNLGDQLSDYTDPGTKQRAGAKVYFENHGLGDLLDHKRPLSPSFHLQFSEMLANFSNFCVRRIVEAHDGRLIYSGGDDVLALLPADKALDCARALREAFRGNPQYLNTLRGAWRREDKVDLPLFDFDQPGFIRLHQEALGLAGEPKEFCAMVPGPAADCSVGIAIAHFKSPLQDVVRAAQAAEKRAKSKLGRSAVAVTLMKRSGETVEWSCKWESGGLDAYRQMVAALQNKVVSAKFPHRIAELVDGYQVDETAKLGGTKPVAEFEHVVSEVLEREVGVAAERQRGTKFASKEVATLQTTITKYLNPMPAGQKVRDLIGLCQTVAFIARNLPEQPRDRDRFEASTLKSETPEPADRQPAS